jgi:Flp pilus assembly protein TadB
MADEKPRLGPWLRQYAEERKPDRKERIKELAGAAAVGLASLVVLAAVLLVFVRYPLPTLAALLLLWIVGFLTLTVKRRRAAARERELRDSAGRD